MPYTLQKSKFCDFFKNEKTFYDNLLTVSDLPAKGVCPWPRGTYTIRGNVISFGIVPPYYSGDFMLEEIIKKNEVVVNGYQMYITIVRSET